MSLAKIITQKIKSEGPISFSTFMEMALYYPQKGYYNSPFDKIGKGGDYCTSPVISNLLGVSLGIQLEEMWRILGEKPFTIIEYGAGTGYLCRDIIEYLKSNSLLYNELKYIIIERSPAMRQKENTILSEKVSWCENIGESITNGCILSNEMIDNLPVHQVIMEEDLMEVFVDYKDGFVEVLEPAADELKNYLSVLNVNLPKGHRTEINLKSIDWLNQVANILKKGFIITIDYGFPSSELYATKHREGTVVCYRKHQVNCNPYINIGKQDITAHVNFSALNYWGTKKGLACCGYTDQIHFLLGLGLNNYIRKIEQEEPSLYFNEREKMSWLHTLLVDMGSKYKVLIQQAGLEKVRLSGLMFSLSRC